MDKKKTSSVLKENEAAATNTMLRTSPRKLNLVAQLIRGKKADQALNDLVFCRRRVAPEVRKVLLSAIANAENNHNLDIDQLFISEATVGKAMVMKRFRPRARGRVGKILKPFSKIRIVVQEREETA